MDQWLVRTAQNRISGPFTRDEICAKIREGELKLQDEVCRANHYWVALHEHEEVQAQLGVTVPKSKSDEVTETETETEVLPEYATEGSAPEMTAVLRRPAKPSSRPAVALPMPDPFGGAGHALGQLERFSFWRGFAWILVLVVLVLLFLVLKVLRA